VRTIVKSGSRRRGYGRWICRIDGYEATDVRDRERHYNKEHPDVSFDPRFMARFWKYKKGVKPRAAKTLCTRCEEEFLVGERTQHLKKDHGLIRPNYREYFVYPE